MKDNDEDLEWRAAIYALGTMTLAEARAYEEDAERVGEGQPALHHKFGEVVELLGVAALDAEPPVSVRDRLEAFMAAEPRLPDPPPSPTTELLTVRRNEGEWFEVTRGVLAKTVFQDPRKGSTSYLVRFAPGSNATLHRHPQVEECVVIEGDFHVDGKALGPGDYHCAMAGSIHDRPYSVGGALVMIIASEPMEVLER